MTHPDKQTTYSAEERAAMLSAMQETSNRFYAAAFRIGCHPFIEFCGLMNEYIKVCQRAHLAGQDFNETTGHGGGALPIATYEAAYIGEKLGCIYGPSLQDPENLRAFMRAAGLAKSEPEL